MKNSDKNTKLSIPSSQGMLQRKESVTVPILQRGKPRHIIPTETISQSDSLEIFEEKPPGEESSRNLSFFLLRQLI